MTCSECDNLLETCADELAASSQRDELEAHLAQCRRCGDQHRQRQTAARLLCALPASPPAGLKSAILQQLGAPDCQPVRQVACEEARPLVSARLDGERLPELEVHLANCSSCTRLALALQDQRDLLRSAPEAVTPDHLKEDILARVAAYQQSALLVILTALRRSRRAAWSVGIAASLLVFAGLGVRDGRDHRQPQLGPGHVSPPVGRSVAKVAPPSERPVMARGAPVEDTPTVPDTAPTPDAARAVHREEVRVAGANRAARTTSIAMATTAPPRGSATPASATVSEARRESPSAAKEPDWDKSLRELEGWYAELAAVRARGEASPTAAAKAPAADADAPRAKPVLPVAYVDDSPGHAPVPESFASAVPATPARQADSVKFEAPPAEPRIVLRKGSPSSGQREVIADIRENLKRRRPTPPPAIAPEDETSRTAKLTVWESGF